MEFVALRGGQLVCGAVGAEPHLADVLIADGRIAEVIPPGTLEPVRGETTIDCTGHVVAPGFIDIHTHSDLTRLAYPGAESRVCQGVTTEVVGNCGMSPAPLGDHGATLRSTIGPVDLCPHLELSWDGFGEYLDRLDAAPSAVNTIALAGHGSARHAVLGDARRDATARERAAIAGLLDEALSAGAWGVSFGLMYAPGELADTAELRAAARTAGRADALVAAHVRSYNGPELQGAVDEFVDFADGARVQVSHLRAVGAGSRGVAGRVLERLHERRAAGVDVAADAYPYTAGHTTALQLLPRDLRSAGVVAALEAIRGDRARLVHELHDSPFPPGAITIARTGSTPTPACGRTLAELSGRSDDWPELLLELFERHGGAVDVIVDGSDRRDMEESLGDPLVAIGSDGATLSPAHAANLPHPRSFGTFPRALRLLLDAGMGLGDAIAKATSLPAERLGLSDRGLLRPGAVADLVVLDPARLQDRASYSSPAVTPAGIRDVLVAGEGVLRDGTPTDARPGALLRRRR
jgi:N-acyl-D-amino-acid deacylase